MTTRNNPGEGGPFRAFTVKVGKTNDIKSRFKDHDNASGIEMTSSYYDLGTTQTQGLLLNDLEAKLIVHIKNGNRRGVEHITAPSGQETEKFYCNRDALRIFMDDFNNFGTQYVENPEKGAVAFDALFPCINK